MQWLCCDFRDFLSASLLNLTLCVFYSKRVNSLAISMDGYILVSGSHDSTARVWHVSSKQCLKVVNHKGLFQVITEMLSSCK